MTAPIHIIAGTPNSGKTTAALRAAGDSYLFACPTVAQALDLGSKLGAQILTGGKDIAGSDAITVCTHGCLPRALRQTKAAAIIIDEAHLACERYDNQFAGVALRAAVSQKSKQIILISNDASAYALAQYCRLRGRETAIEFLRSLSSPRYCGEIKDYAGILELGGGTAIICCSVKKLKDFAYYLRLNNNSYGILHSRLSTRKKLSVIAAFNAGEIDFLLSTDAIAIGCDFHNLRQICFLELYRCGEILPPADIRQIAYRAGRGKREGKIYVYLPTEAEDAAVKAALASDEEAHLDKILIDERREYLSDVAVWYYPELCRLGSVEEQREFIRSAIINFVNLALEAGLRKGEVYKKLEEGCSFGYYDEDDDLVSCSPRYYEAEEFPELDFYPDFACPADIVNCLLGCIPADTDAYDYDTLRTN